MLRVASRNKLVHDSLDSYTEYVLRPPSDGITITLGDP
jgi:hypothetical protein